MQEIAIRLDEARRREFKRFLVASGALHVVAFAFLAWQPAIPTMSSPAVIRVDLVAAPNLSPGPKARPKPKPKPPKPAPVVLPTQATTPKPPRPKPVEKPAPPPQEEPEEVEYEDLMAKLRSEAGEEAPEQEPPDEPVQTASAGGAGGLGVPVPPELAAWMRDARIHVRRSWVVPPAFEMETLVVEVKVDLDAAGNVKGDPNVSRRSGNPWYDENVVRSIRKASPLPAPPEAGTWTFLFYSDRDA